MIEKSKGSSLSRHILCKGVNRQLKCVKLILFADGNVQIKNENY